ncbi:MAG: AraC family transcriptional regulator [Pseudomonadota bacterium]
MQYTFFAPTLDLMMQTARSYHLDPVPLLEASGIDPASVIGSDERVSFDQVDDFYDKIAGLIPDPNFGLKFGQSWHPSQMGVLGYAWMTSCTLRSAFERLTRYIKIISDFYAIELKETSKHLSLVINTPGEEGVPAFHLDAAMATLLAMVQSNAGEAFRPLSIQIAHPEPEDTRPFYSLFQCPIVFGSTSSSFTLSIADADAPRHCTNARLAQVHDQLLIEYLANLEKENIVERTKMSIINNLPSGHISDAIVAQSMLMSERTLQRRLHEVGTTFNSILKEVRKELAISYISDKKISLTEITFLLGYSEISSFTHAFKRWTGQSPSAFRGDLP